MAHKFGATLALLFVLWGLFCYAMGGSDEVPAWDPMLRNFGAAIFVYVFVRIVGGILGWIWFPNYRKGEITYRRLD